MMLQMDLVMVENEKVLRTFEQYTKRRVEETVDHYTAKHTDKDYATLDDHRSPAIDPGRNLHKRIKLKHEGPAGRGFDHLGHPMRDDDERGFKLQPDSDRSADEYEER